MSTWALLRETPADLIIGQWHGDGPKIMYRQGDDLKHCVEHITVEFRTDGTFEVVGEKIAGVEYHEPTYVTGTYVFVSQTELELKAKSNGQETTRSAKVTVTKDELTVVPATEGGFTMNLKRIR